MTTVFCFIAGNWLNPVKRWKIDFSKTTPQWLAFYGFFLSPIYNQSWVNLNWMWVDRLFKYFLQIFSNVSFKNCIFLFWATQLKWATKNKSFWVAWFCQPWEEVCGRLGVDYPVTCAYYGKPLKSKQKHKNAEKGHLRICNAKLYKKNEKIASCVNSFEMNSFEMNSFGPSQSATIFAGNDLEKPHNAISFIINHRACFWKSFAFSKTNSKKWHTKAKH